MIMYIKTSRKLQNIKNIIKICWNMLKIWSDNMKYSWTKTMKFCKELQELCSICCVSSVVRRSSFFFRILVVSPTSSLLQDLLMISSYLHDIWFIQTNFNYRWDLYLYLIIPISSLGSKSFWAYPNLVQTLPTHKENVPIFIGSLDQNPYI